jgi:hypothetical protein
MFRLFLGLEYVFLGSSRGFNSPPFSPGPPEGYRGRSTTSSSSCVWSSDRFPCSGSCSRSWVYSCSCSCACSRSCSCSCSCTCTCSCAHPCSCAHSCFCRHSGHDTVHSCRCCYHFYCFSRDSSDFWNARGLPRSLYLCSGPRRQLGRRSIQEILEKGFYEEAGEESAHRKVSHIIFLFVYTHYILFRAFCLEEWSEGKTDPDMTQFNTFWRKRSKMEKKVRRPLLCNSLSNLRMTSGVQIPGRGTCTSFFLFFITTPS